MVKMVVIRLPGILRLIDRIRVCSERQSVLPGEPLGYGSVLPVLSFYAIDELLNEAM